MGWALGVAAFVGHARCVEDAAESDYVFAPFNVASFEWFVAVWAQLYFRLEVILFLPRCSLWLSSSIAKTTVGHKN